MASMVQELRKENEQLREERDMYRRLSSHATGSPSSISPALPASTTTSTSSDGIANCNKTCRPKKPDCKKTVEPTLESKPAI